MPMYFRFGIVPSRFIWNADGTAGPDNDGSPEMAPTDWGNPAHFGFRRFAERVRYKH